MYEWAAVEKADDSTLDLRSSERALEHLEDVGQQLSLAFNNEGTLLATGGEVVSIFWTLFVEN